MAVGPSTMAHRPTHQAIAGLDQQGVLLMPMILLQRTAASAALPAPHMAATLHSKAPLLQKGGVRSAASIGKTLGIAKAARMDILRQLAAASIAVDGSNDGGCTAEDINKMFVAGFFQNLASRRGSDRSFMAAESQQVGKIHMGSALQEVNNDRLPHWMAFVELFRSNQVFLTNVVPCNPEWLAELAPLYHQERWQILKVCSIKTKLPKL